MLRAWRGPRRSNGALPLVAASRRGRAAARELGRLPRRRGRQGAGRRPLELERSEGARDEGMARDPGRRGARRRGGGGADDKAVVADLSNWNEAKVLEMKEWLATMAGEELDAARERVRRYEETRTALRQTA